MPCWSSFTKKFGFRRHDLQVAGGWRMSFGGLKVLAGQIVRLYELCPIGFRAVDDTEREFIAAMDAAEQEG